MARKKTKKDYIFSVGKRKTSIARVRLFKGTKESTVNGQLVGKYFPGRVKETVWQKPLVLTDTLEKYYFSAKVTGGGKEGQLDAVVHALAKTLNLTDREKFRSPLKQAGLLTRDARARQRRMVGTGGKARRKKQSPKR